MKSKKPSAANLNSSQQPEPANPILFLDRNFGRHIVPEILRAQTDLQIEIHDDHFKPDAKDQEILAAIGRRE
ncbi:MAG: hypothetical protein A2487_21555 [Candidatus Raymondbacteria bacterium RifOxyC12_full_50_8]|nr:MAG: hypothetical protein A2487_21555 [Candidatus Raymondbacteria bacterium RifOxyC12_full_50_8]